MTISINLLSVLCFGYLCFIFCPEWRKYAAELKGTGYRGRKTLVGNLVSPLATI
jgi:hypothetical protein